MKNTSDTGTGQSITWIYDAEGHRAQKLVAGGSWTLYVHDAFGKLVASYNNNGVTPACNGTCYMTYDMLGSVRLVTDTNQNVVARHDFIPFGEEIPNGVAGRNGNFAGASNVTQGFTGQEADGGTASLDFYNARHFAAALGSFMQPDPGNAGADILHPQSWNAYAYVRGNPLGGADPTGLDCLARTGPHANTVGCHGGGNYGGTDDPTGGGDGGVSIDGGSTVAIGTFGDGNPAGGESGVQCPNNACSGVATSSNGTTTPVQYQATAGSGPQGYATPAQTYEVNGQFATEQQYQQNQQMLIQAYISTQRQTLAAALGQPLNNCASGLIGGNLNCTVGSNIQSTYVANPDNNCLSNGSGTDYRCGSLSTGYSLHFETNDDVITVHMDTMNPGLLSPFSVQFPGVLVHFGVDVIGGHTFFRTGVPH